LVSLAINNEGFSIRYLDVMSGDAAN